MRRWRCVVCGLTGEDEGSAVAVRVDVDGGNPRLIIPRERRTWLVYRADDRLAVRCQTHRDHDEATTAVRLALGVGEIEWRTTDTIDA